MTFTEYGFNISSTTGAKGGVEITYTSGTLHISNNYYRVRAAQYYIYISVVFGRPLYFCLFFFLVIVLFVFHIMASDYPLGIFKLCSNLRIAVRFDIMQCYMSE
jgi:hypothetical protein